MELQINGEKRTFEDGAVLDTVAAVLQHLQIEDDRGMAVAVNDRVIPRGKWSETGVEEGDRIEIIRATQGG